MFKREITFSTEYGLETWQRLKDESEGFFETNHGVWAYQQLDGGERFSELTKLNIKIVAHIKREVINNLRLNTLIVHLRKNMIGILCYVLLILLAYYFIRRGREQAELINKNNEILKRNEEILNLTSSLALVGGWEYDVIKNTLFWTKQTFILHGLKPRDEMPNVAEGINYYHPESQSLVSHFFSRCVEFGEPFNENWKLMINGVVKDVHVTGRAEWVEGKIVRINGAIQDITLRMNMERARNEEQTKNQSLSRLASLGTLSAGVAHEINNPLAIAKGFIQLMKPKVLERLPELDMTFIHLLSAIDRISSIVRGLKALAHKESDLPIEIKIDEFIKELNVIGKLLVKDKKIDLKITPFNKPILVYGNPGKLQQVFMNLITNARDATLTKSLDGGVITISASEIENSVHVVVKDQGVGIPKEHLEKIFDPFFTTKPVGEGTGLGLPISNAILKSMGGEIKIESEYGHHSTITVILPVHPEKGGQS